MQQCQPNNPAGTVGNNRGVGWGRNRQTADPTPCDHTTAEQKDDPAPVCGRHTRPYRRPGVSSTPGSCAQHDRPRNISRRASATSMREIAIDSTSAIAPATAATVTSTVMMAAEQDRCR